MRHGAARREPVPLTPLRKYQVRPGYSINKRDAPLLASHIESLGDNIQPEALVEMARPKSSPIHHCFIWDDAKAAEVQRLNQARFYIAAFDIHFEKAPPVRAFPNLRASAGRERSYVPIITVLKSEQMVDMMLSDALRDLRAWKRKYEALRKVAKLRGIFREVDAVSGQ